MMEPLNTIQKQYTMQESQYIPDPQELCWGQGVGFFQENISP